MGSHHSKADKNTGGINTEWRPDLILPGDAPLYLSSKPNTPEDIKLSHSLGIHCIVDMISYEPDRFENEDQVDVLIAAAGLKGAVHHHHFPCDDTLTFDITPVLPKAVRIISECRDSNRGILVHCEAGVSRSTSVVLAFLVEAGLQPCMRAAFEFVRAKRPFVRPNPSFAQQLGCYEAQLLKEPSLFFPWYLLEVYELSGLFTVEETAKALAEYDNNWQAVLGPMLDKWRTKRRSELKKKKAAEAAAAAADADVEVGAAAGSKHP